MSEILKFIELPALHTKYVIQIIIKFPLSHDFSLNSQCDIYIQSKENSHCMFNSKNKCIPCSFISYWFYCLYCRVSLYLFIYSFISWYFILLILYSKGLLPFTFLKNFFVLFWYFLDKNSTFAVTLDFSCVENMNKYFLKPRVDA